jgi:hypothetical protein
MDRRLGTGVELYLLKAESSDSLQHEPSMAQDEPCSEGIFSLLHLLESTSYPSPHSEVAPHHLAAVTQPARLVQHSKDSRKPLCNPISRHDPVPWHLFSFTAGDAERARYINHGRVHHGFFIGSLLATCMFYIHVHSEGAGSRCKSFKVDDSDTETRDFKKAIL